MRYAVECAYNGINYQGWQSQPHRITIQQTIEKCLSTFLREPIEITGCGRTDTGVHAKRYVFHFDFGTPLPVDFIYHMNAILPKDIALNKMVEVPEAFHARYSALLRSYEYFLHGFKSPFLDQVSYRFKFFERIGISQLQEAADILKEFDSYYPFCLSDSGNENYQVEITNVSWSVHAPGQLLFSISANRFLRGMVRLITGMCLNVSLGQISIDEVRTCLREQKLLSKSLSIPAHGLYLADVVYKEQIF